MKIVVTGAGGLIGIPIIRRLAEAGYEVRALARSSRSLMFGHKNITWMLGDIRDERFLESAVAGADYAVHLAGAKSDEADSYAINVGGTEKLLAACEAQGVRGIVYASTISAKFEIKGLYGSTKLAAEERIRASRLNSVILRLSVVYAAAQEGIFGTLVRYARLPFVPLIGPGTSEFRPIHADDVAEAIEKMLSKGFQGKQEYELGGPDLISLNKLASLAGERLARRKVKILHISPAFGLLAARTLSRLMKRTPITVSNVLGMIQDAHVDPSAFYAAFDFHPRTLDKGISDMLHLEAARSTEAQAVMRYALNGIEPSDQLTELYDRSQQRCGTDQYHIPRAILKNMFLLGALDAFTKITDKHGVLQQKLSQASILAECSPLSSDWLLPKKRSRLAIIYIWGAIGLQTAIRFAVGSIIQLFPAFKIKAHA